MLFYLFIPGHTFLRFEKKFREHNPVEESSFSLKAVRSNRSRSVIRVEALKVAFTLQDSCPSDDTG